MGDRASNLRLSPGVRSTLLTALQVLAFSAAWFVAARLAAFTLSGAGGVLAIWPASGLSVAVLANQRRRRWPLWLATIWLANFAQGVAAATPWVVAAGLSCADVLEGALAAALLNRVAGTPITLGPRREVLALVFVAALASTGVTALAGAAVMASWTGGPFHVAWLGWWRANGVGMLLTAPLILAARDGWRQVRTGGVLGGAEIVILLATFSLACATVFHPWSFASAGQLPFILFPWLMWAALRTGPFFTTVAACIAAAFATWGLASSSSEFFALAPTVGDRVLRLQIFVGVVVLSSLLAAAAVVERRRAQEALDRYRLLSEFAGDMMCFFRARDLRILEANAAAVLAYGRSRAELLETTITEVLAPEAREALPGRLAEAGRRPIQYPSVHVHRDGTTFPVEVSLRGIQIDDEPVLLAIVRDVRDRHRLEHELQQAQKMEAVGRLAGGVAHDFNNLLQVINGFAGMSLEDLPQDSPARPALEEISRAAGRAAELTRRLLAFSRKQVFEPVVFNLNDVVADLESMLRRLIGEHIDLVTALSADVGLVKADRGQLEQVVTNLVVNARDAMPHGGTLTLSTGMVLVETVAGVALAEPPPGRYATIEVSDTGTGIAEDLQGRIFEPFFTTKERDKGTGLGLSTVYGIVRQSGGHVMFTSTPGSGTTFRVYLPVADGAATQAPAATPGRTIRSGSGTILLVEDELAVRTLARSLLERLGFTVLDAAGGAEAVTLAASASEPIRLLLTDVIMPGMSGPEVAAAVCRVRPGTKVLYMSGYTDDALTRHGALDKGTVLLQKPFSADQLAAKVWDALGTP
jgi:two-component system, cell cycle sensor histidine kinase and response regulator CckA